MFSNICEQRVSCQAAAPGAPVYRAEHDEHGHLAPIGDTGRDDDVFQFSSIDDERLAQRAEAARLVQKNQPRAIEVIDMNNQRKCADPRLRGATRTLSEPLATVRIQNEYRAGNAPSRRDET
ncbi:MAG: hypothetical protein A3I61_05215 [Acidobacteria bacterium RIFCSPLOWO2_02_FULL_68_18]|nr:MAG: hypothetical protein A3I61_05215 [Acidobacteria bacterium RIFCSPLOWO2_02_FULL_68_18]OFW49244.1 MAG: hypothetical protein A3G77_04015 [Acidobacteria bacterium RIFCSPLOWO2_12_FULL_68_19]